MIATVVLVACLVTQNSFALNPNYRECTDDDCNNDDEQIDPRNQALDLYNAIESRMVDTIPMADFELYASFHSGSLYFDYWDSGDSLCVCPLTKKADEMYAVFHDDLTLQVTYNWTYQWSPDYNYTGNIGIAAQIFYSVYFINETNGDGPSIDRINITSFDIFSWWIEGQPLEMLEQIPDELFKKSMVVVLKQTFEDSIVSVYNNAIQDMKGNFQTFAARNRQRNSIRLLDSLKSRRRISHKRSRYFHKK